MIADHLMIQIQEHVIDTFYKYKGGFELYAPDDWTLPLAEFLDPLTEKYSSKVELKELEENAGEYFEARRIQKERDYQNQIVIKGIQSRQTQEANTYKQALYDSQQTEMNFFKARHAHNPNSGTEQFEPSLDLTKRKTTVGTVRIDAETERIIEEKKSKYFGDKYDKLMKEEHKREEKLRKEARKKKNKEPEDEFVHETKKRKISNNI